MKNGANSLKPNLDHSAFYKKIRKWINLFIILSDFLSKIKNQSRNIMVGIFIIFNMNLRDKKYTIKFMDGQMAIYKIKH